MQAKELETEISDSVVDSDLKVGAMLIWRYRGSPYEVKVTEIHGGTLII